VRFRQPGQPSPRPLPKNRGMPPFSSKTVVPTSHCCVCPLYIIPSANAYHKTSVAAIPQLRGAEAEPQSAQSTQRGLGIAGVLSRPAFRGGYRATPLPSTGSGCTLHGKKRPPPTWHGRPARGGIMGKMPMPRQATTESFSSSWANSRSFRPCHSVAFWKQRRAPG